MGMYDRDYQRSNPYGQQPGFNFSAPQSMAVKLIVLNVVVYLAQLMSERWVTETFLLYDQWWREPWQAYRLLTYGFLHAPNDLWHILLNMFALWLFGREVEHRYGSREFLAFYLTAIVVAGLVWTFAEIPNDDRSSMLGASGGVTAVLILFAMNFPHQTVLFMFFIPMPMWVLAIIIVFMDAMGASGRAGGSNVAFTAHLGGAMFGFLYFQWGARLERFLPGNIWTKRFKPKPKLRVVDSDEIDATTDSRVDEILKKIQEQGQDSLTRGERRILEKASREYQKKRGE